MSTEIPVQLWLRSSAGAHTNPGYISCWWFDKGQNNRVAVNMKKKKVGRKVLELVKNRASGEHAQWKLAAQAGCLYRRINLVFDKTA